MMFRSGFQHCLCLKEKRDDVNILFVSVDGSVIECMFCALDKRIDILHVFLCIKRWIMNKRTIEKKVENIPANDIRRYLIL